MKRILISTLIAVSLLTACEVVPAGHGRERERGYRSDEVVIAPILPSIVVLDAEPYYYYSGFTYYYKNDRWFYSRSRNGPWADLPRDRYPRGVKFKGRNGKRDDYRNRDRRDDYRNRDQHDDYGDHDDHRRRF